MLPFICLLGSTCFKKKKKDVRYFTLAACKKKAHEPRTGTGNVRLSTLLCLGPDSEGCWYSELLLSSQKIYQPLGRKMFLVHILQMAIVQWPSCKNHSTAFFNRSLKSPRSPPCLQLTMPYFSCPGRCLEKPELTVWGHQGKHSRRVE